MKEVVKVKGNTILSFCNICINLKYIARPDLLNVINEVNDPNGWYSFSILSKLFNLIEKTYEKHEIIFELIGMETMRLWYENGEGAKKIKKGVDFLRYQTGSEGYWSMVQGPKNEIGEFILKELNESENEGFAILNDTSPFHHSFVKGILQSGMKGGGDLMWIDIQYSKETREFFVMFKLKTGSDT